VPPPRLSPAAARLLSTLADLFLVLRDRATELLAVAAAHVVRLSCCRLGVTEGAVGKAVLAKCVCVCVFVCVCVCVCVRVCVCVCVWWWWWWRCQ
jgi:hypothetical protein